MNHLEFQLRGVSDPRLAVHAASPLPAWLWSTDGARILWANPVGAKLFGAAHAAVLAERTFGPADQHRRQVAQLANRLPLNGAVRLERLRGFGAALGALVTCGCARLDFADGTQGPLSGILVTAADSSGRGMPLIERLQRLVDGIASPIAAFTRDGMFINASDAARSLLGFRDLSEAGLDEARNHALRQGRAELPVGIGQLVLQRVGSGTDVGLIALIKTNTPPSPPAEHGVPAWEAPAGFTLVDEFAEQAARSIETPHAQPAPDYEAPALTGEAPAEFALADEPVAAEEPMQATPAPVAEPLIIETPSTETIAETAPSAREAHPHEPSPYVEAVADEPEPSEQEPSEQESPPAEEPPASFEHTALEQPVTLLPWLDEVTPRTTPLRFMWRMDADGHFSLGSDEFTNLIGAQTAATFGRLWSDVAETYGLDPEGRVQRACATRDTWSGITLNWPVDGGEHLPVELSGLPTFDRARNFTGYRGFGVCRDLDALARLAALRRYELFNPPARRALSADIVPPDIAARLPAPGANADSCPSPELSAPIAIVTSQPTDLETAVETPKEFSQQSKDSSSESSQELPKETQQDTPKNVLPFRPLSDPKDPKSLTLTPVENSAFNELARQLAERLERQNMAPASPPPAETPEPPAFVADQPASAEAPPAVSEQPGWLSKPEPPARGESRRDKALLDLLPVGVLIYRLDRLVYANTAFLERIGYPDLQALEEAGGLDALYVEPGVSTASSTSDTGTPVTISASQPNSEHASPKTEARLYTIAWDGESALALIFAGAASADIASVLVERVASEPVIEEPAIEEAVLEKSTSAEPSAVGHANAEELGAILDTTAEGILMFDAEGNINSANRSAEALFGHDGAELVQRNLAGLFAPESAQAVKDYLENIKGAEFASVLAQGRDVLASVRGGGLIPVSMTMGRTQPTGPNFFAVFRDLSQVRKSESELRDARRQTDRAANAKADMLARISHEVRTPLNAIIGFAEVMIGERFGALGNERYIEYMKDIRASGERVIAIINDLLDLARIETGKLDLAFANQNLNDLVEQCVAVMQPQANRERIIIRTSLAHMLPQVVADARALRQITLNLIGNSIHLANAGGQVIVSTALSDVGEVVLRVRDTGHGLNDNEVAAAMEPFRTPAPSDHTADSSGVSLSLTRALVEANRAKFQIKTGGRSGTLIEVVFPHAMERA
jgi:PAS domain S-box-containing protein